MATILTVETGNPLYPTRTIVEPTILKFAPPQSERGLRCLIRVCVVKNQPMGGSRARALVMSLANAQTIAGNLRARGYRVSLEPAVRA